MDVYSGAERLMGMDEESWRRHANPLSVITRIPILPLMLVAIYSRRYIGIFSLIPILLLVGWTWYNPRAFKEPADLNNWASKVVLGERLFLARHSMHIPDHHFKAVLILVMLSAAGIIPCIYGVWVYNAWAAAFGCTLTVLPKIWFCDRMVWIYEDLDRSMGDEFPFRSLNPTSIA